MDSRMFRSLSNTLFILTSTAYRQDTFISFANTYLGENLEVSGGARAILNPRMRIFYSVVLTRPHKTV